MSVRWSERSFVDLRVRSAVFVTAEWRADGGVVPPVVFAPDARLLAPTRVAFLDPWWAGGPAPWAPPVVTRAADGARVPLAPAQDAPQGLPVWAFDAAPGDAYECGPARSQTR